MGLQDAYGVITPMQLQSLEPKYRRKVKSLITDVEALKKGSPRIMCDCYFKVVR